MPTNHQLTPVDAELSVCIPNYKSQFSSNVMWWIPPFGCDIWNTIDRNRGSPQQENPLLLAGPAARRLQSAGSMGWLLTECTTQPAWSDPPVYFQTNFYTSGHW